MKHGGWGKAPARSNTAHFYVDGRSICGFHATQAPVHARIPEGLYACVRCTDGLKRPKYAPSGWSVIRDKQHYTLQGQDAALCGARTRIPPNRQANLWPGVRPCHNCAAHCRGPAPYNPRREWEWEG